METVFIAERSKCVFTIRLKMCTRSLADGVAKQKSPELRFPAIQDRMAGASRK